MGRALAKDSWATVRLPAASTAVTRRRYVPGNRSLPEDVRASQLSCCTPAAGCRAPATPTGCPSVVMTAHCTVIPGSAGASKDI